MHDDRVQRLWSRPLISGRALEFLPIDSKRRAVFAPLVFSGFAPIVLRAWRRHCIEMAHTPDDDALPLQ